MLCFKLMFKISQNWKNELTNILQLIFQFTFRGNYQIWYRDILRLEYHIGNSTSVNL